MPFSDAMLSLLGGAGAPAAQLPLSPGVPSITGFSNVQVPTIQGLQAGANPTIQGLTGGDVPAVYGFGGFSPASVAGLSGSVSPMVQLPTIPSLEVGLMRGVLKPEARGKVPDASEGKSVRRPGTEQAATGAAGAAAAAPGDTASISLAGLGPGQREEFFRRAMRLGLVMEGQTGIPAEVFAAMFANESNFGNAPGNIAGGVKAAPGAPGAIPLQTWEMVNGVRTPMLQWFQSSPTALGGMQVVAENLQKGRYAPAYQALVSGQIDRDEFLRRVNAAGYATNPVWAQNEIVPLMGEASRYRAEAQAANAQAAQGVGGAATVGYREGAQALAAATANQNQYAQRAGLSRDVAAAICGVSAADAFARVVGRTPTVDEAFNMARDQGMWDLASGMHGPQSEVNLLNRLGAPAQLVSPTEERLGAEIQAGRPVILDTAGHYYFLAGYNPDNHTFQATDAVGGGRWMTLGQISALKYGAIRTAIIAQ